MTPAVTDERTELIIVKRALDYCDKESLTVNNFPFPDLYKTSMLVLSKVSIMAVPALITELFLDLKDISTLLTIIIHCKLLF
jgi:hypothetical protein